MKNLIQDTIEKIKEQRISPEPKWKYLVKKYFLWALFAAVLILAAISFSAAYDNANNLDWDLYRFIHQSRFLYILSILPYFWIILIAIFLIAAFFEIRKTETGYRYSWSRILLIIAGGIAVFGGFISLLGFGGKLNSKLVKEVPFYSQHMMVTKESQWMQPSRGFLAGTITYVSENKIGIKDLNSDDWNINIDDNTLVKPSVNISREEMIKIIGTKTDENNFKAKEIRPWTGKGERKGSNGQGNRSSRARGN
ncbi:MAG: hypothetical protein UX02_C0003G0015 [Candidatus Moranbacteria bacterium GW2011_GWC1_45_18]|nr:MAG: hypothetical protein UT79_C0004G0015 [Candidatus Moranbacteria bacterium GW2011_GWC2_40_12]KKT33624.1 MAG: hypothetical protein UW19_C0007G0015 [Candidatus Moranbacteria bacterium GW2011_GWF2_44_10]KKT72310.1 MAG: hypothetical protein UW66_C0006G0006 [Candidatus Moranbacteria bacterium GW2011_GWF1_44_4]KKT99472.1 MAG: hypothetical protein UX02_C0003G0015 [Candidatus Moranbacteria bacterium GW2011_GWC1_45_18]OGI22381.1 MAG: hypothetical protein A2194_01005 [Candidatus Moranbacteria bacte